LKFANIPSPVKLPRNLINDCEPMLKGIKTKGAFAIVNDRGLHTRPSTELVKCAANFKSEVRLIYQRQTVNAKSLLGILMLAAPKGARITVEAEGVDAEQAVASILLLARSSFHICY
jgi:phosphocarrier protein HPr